METQFTKKKVAVLGLGLEGKDLVKFLLKQKAKITVFDEKEEKDIDFSGVKREKIKIICGKKYLKRGLNNFDAIYRSPGVYRYLPEIVKAEKKGTRVLSATKLFFDLCPAKVIGVTGTKGKGTTCSLIYKILKQSGEDVYLAGNIGKPYLELLPKLKKTSWVILELSSFQLIDLDKSPDISVVLNITLDHLDWHKDKREYIDSKVNIVEHQGKSDFTIINYDYQTSKEFKKFTKGKVFYFSKSKKVNGCYVKEGEIVLEINKKKQSIGKTYKLLLRGRHNWENVTASVCASYLAGARMNAIKRGVFSFKGLEHRLELVNKVKGISFYNDSFSTSPQPTIAAINSFDEPITLILGGSDKGLDYFDMARKIAMKKNVINVILIGEISPKIKKALKKADFSGRILELGKVGMKKIVDSALKITSKGGVVLLSPATASFDMFENYKDRGNQFSKVVKTLKV